MAKLSTAKYFEMIGHKPHPRQLLFHNSTARFRIPCCGRRFGKSMMGARDEEPRLLLPDRRVWCVGPTYDLSEKEFRVIWNDMMLKLEFARDKRIKKAYNKKTGDMYIEFPWQTRIECRSAEHQDSLVGEKLDHVIMAEAAKHKTDTWDRFIRPALSDRRGSATFPSTPEGFNWYYDVWFMGQSPDEPDYESWQFPSWDNPYVYPQGRRDPEILLLERSLSPQFFEQEIAADFKAFVGKIYSAFRETTHCERWTFRPEWPNYIAYDPGYTNAFAWVEFQVSPRSEVHVWREHYAPYMTLEQHIEHLKSRENPPGYHLDCAFGDAADPEAAMYISQHFCPAMALPEAKKNWREGVDLVNTFLALRSASDTFDLTEVQTQKEMDEAELQAARPMLFVDWSCMNTIREFNGYRAPEPSSTRRPVNPREAAQKYDDHALDALRYGMMHVFKLGCTSHLSDLYTDQGQSLDARTMDWHKESDERDFGFFTFEGSSRSEDSFFTTADLNF